MKNSPKPLSLILAAGVLWALPMAALAQATNGVLMVYAPNATATTTSVPTLSEWGMLGLSFLLAAVAYFGLRNKSGGRPLAAIILALGVAAVGGYTKQSVMTLANAVPVDCPTLAQCYMQAAGGTMNVRDNGTIFDTTITNNSGVTQTVISVTPVDPNWDQIFRPANTPECVATLVVPSGTSCYLRINNRR